MSTDLSELATTSDWEALLSDTEQRLVRHAERGQILDLRTGDSDRDAPERATKWDASRVLEVLALGERDDWPLHRRGLVLAGARIDGAVDLDFGTIDAPMEFQYCVFDQRVTMVGATLKAVAMPGTHLLDGLNADSIDVTGGVYLCYGFAATGEVRLVGAKIGRDLSCIGGSFKNPNGRALSADGIDVTGSVFLSATGYRFIGKRFAATGEVRLVDAKIGSVLECRGGSFSNPNGRALSAEGAHVTGSVFLGWGFAATGEVRLFDAKIGGNLDCDAGSFSNPNGVALNAEGAHVTGWFFARASLAGTVDVRGASVGPFVDDVGGWPDGWQGDGFSFRDFGHSASVHVRGGWSGCDGKAAGTGQVPTRTWPRCTSAGGNQRLPVGC